LNSQTFVAFDLDDTLYPEDDYHTSGLRAVARYAFERHGRECANELLDWKSAGVRDLWGRLCQELALDATAKIEFLRVYREHVPAIRLPPASRDTLALAARKCAGIAIVTDGRSVTQRLKADALGLTAYPLYISEEWRAEKPDPGRFIPIQNTYKAPQYVYVGDNPKKDFKGPNELGWLTIGVRGTKRNVHSQCTRGLAPIYLPSIWLDELGQLRSCLENRRIEPPEDC
jgi:putative hydrolase of the HAD superfamily